MITYQLQKRVLRILQGPKELSFPNTLTIDAEYGPPEAFGASNGPSRLALQGSKINLIFNANTGHLQVQSIPSLPPLSAQFEKDNVSIELKGTSLHIQTKCENDVDLHNTLLTCLYGFPALLNIEFPDPPVMLSLTGKLGETEFRFEHQEATYYFKPRTKDGLEKHVIDSINNIQSLQGQFHAATQYFHTASRLIVIGISSWEFMAETILNFCKVLQVLFGEQMDDVRAGLASLGYSDDEIEMDFIPLMVLRNHFDIGHAQSIIPQMEQLQVLYAYLSGSEDNIRYLIKRVFEQIVEERSPLTKKDYLGFEPNEQKKFDQLINKIRPRIKTANKTAS
jgi:hypothetical protein